jgi:pyruvate,orthophosphate dikinase
MKNNAMVNDHTDAGYDQAVLKRLADVHQRATPLLNRLTKLAPRLGGYADRLARAAARVAAGELSYVAKIIADSYHTVWFELHEDLLALAGLSRATLAQAHATRAG